VFGLVGGSDHRVGCPFLVLFGQGHQRRQEILGAFAALLPVLLLAVVENILHLTTGVRLVGRISLAFNRVGHGLSSLSEVVDGRTALEFLLRVLVGWAILVLVLGSVMHLLLMKHVLPVLTKQRILRRQGRLYGTVALLACQWNSQELLIESPKLWLLDFRLPLLRARVLAFILLNVRGQ